MLLQAQEPVARNSGCRQEASEGGYRPHRRGRKARPGQSRLLCWRGPTVFRIKAWACKALGQRASQAHQQGAPELCKTDRAQGVTSSRTGSPSRGWPTPMEATAAQSWSHAAGASAAGTVARLQRSRSGTAAAGDGLPGLHGMDRASAARRRTRLPRLTWR